jgi:predicted nicotinamide N-methyase
VQRILLPDDDGDGDGRERRYLELKFKQRFTVAPGSSNPNSDMTGTWVWPTARPLLEYLLHTLHSTGRDEKSPSSPTRVLELGAGCGLVGMGIAAACNAEVVMTDHADAVESLQKNVNLNLIFDKEEEKSCISVAQLSWGNSSDMSNIDTLYSSDYKPFDLIVGSDLLYDPNSHVALLETMQHFAEKGNAPVYLGYPPRSVSEERFIELATEKFDVDVQTLDDEGKAMLAVCRIKR